MREIKLFSSPVQVQCLGLSLLTETLVILEINVKVIYGQTDLGEVEILFAKDDLQNIRLWL